jgi:hypothetical protein
VIHTGSRKNRTLGLWRVGKAGPHKKEESVMGYSLEQFSQQCHQILKHDPGVEGRKKVCALVRNVLKDENFVKKHLTDDLP